MYSLMQTLVDTGKVMRMKFCEQICESLDSGIVAYIHGYFSRILSPRSPEEGSKMFLRNVSSHPQFYISPQSKIP
jgi:hypothetical protein